MKMILDHSSELDLKEACQSLEISRATVYRRKNPAPRRYGPFKPRRRPKRALSRDEKQEVLERLHSPRFIDDSPEQVYAKLLEDGVHLCSPRTMYRILKQAGEVKERRRLREHPRYKRPELLAQAPNELWSWDVTKIKGPGRGRFYSLYVILDVFSRCVVGWHLSKRATADISKYVIQETLAKHDLTLNQLTVHSDRGSEFKGSVGHLFEELGIRKSQSRPRVSNDNPYSESHFKTLKYHRDFPERFSGFKACDEYLISFFDWYNTEHRHSGIAYLTPYAVHTGESKTILVRKQEALDDAYKAHPERFVNGRPQVKRPPSKVWINDPSKEPQKHTKLSVTVSQTR